MEKDFQASPELAFYRSTTTFGMEDFDALHSWIFLEHNMALLFAAVGNTCNELYGAIKEDD